jgi:hypothetical protein
LGRNTLVIGPGGNLVEPLGIDLIDNRAVGLASSISDKNRGS